MAERRPAVQWRLRWGAHGGMLVRTRGGAVAHRVSYELALRYKTSADGGGAVVELELRDGRPPLKPATMQGVTQARLKRLRPTRTGGK